MSDQSGTLPPLMMFRSFLTIGSGYVAHVLCTLGVTAAIGYTCFPEFVEFMNLTPEQQQQVIEVDPFDAIPRGMFAAVVATVALLSVVLGAVVAWTAPFSRFAHVIFLAVLLFVNYLQMATTEAPSKKSLTMVYMVLFPLAVVIGGRWASQQLARRSTGHDDPVSLSDDDAQYDQ